MEHGNVLHVLEQNGANANVENRNIHFIIITDEYRRDKGLDKTK